jgi:DNA-directed RNA polymerase specialized sigma24 family protein
MTPDQFAALAKLLRLRTSVSTAAARLHFVDGLRIADAARTVGCSANAANNCVARCRAGVALARRVAGL